MRGVEGSFAGLTAKEPEAGIINEKRTNTKYGLDIHYYCSAATGSGVAVL